MHTLTAVTLVVAVAVTASWYGADFHGRTAADGNVYDMHAMTAAHTNLPFGTRVLVQRRDDPGVRVWVVINDRGPWCTDALAEGRLVPHPTRDLDLSLGAFRAIAPLGEGLVDVLVQPYILGAVPQESPVPWPD